MTKGYDDVHCGFGFGVRNEGGASLLDFAKAFDIVIVNSYFQKKEDHLALGNGLEIKKVRKKRVVNDQPIIKWGALTKDKAQELGEKLLAMGAWRSSGDPSNMWTTTAGYIKEVSREVLGGTKCHSRGHKWDWWWNGEIQGRLEAKKAVFIANRERRQGGEEDKHGALEESKERGKDEADAERMEVECDGPIVQEQG
ncbi:uncharacterized protein [Nicotiana sylvestris]|uniref:uncharacterized protein n=1 Tax=Nicotiana sylvestris TaxID=4096 RepID=UPI00388CBC9B